ncbi:MAG: hypothetical protein HKN87_09870 [Saprospiraceae bacterium]|nr:hypothetical protein [Saprospiraceae bacterium]
MCLIKYNRPIILLILLASTTTPLLSQGILNRVLNRSKQKIEQGVEDMLVEKASEAISRKIYKSMSDAFDKMILDAQEQDSAYQVNYSDSLAIKYRDIASGWMERMNETADLPESYKFDVKVYSEITSGRKKKDKQEQIMYFSSTEPLFAIEQLDGKDIRIIVMDSEKDVTVLYMIDKDGTKTAQAIPNMISLAAGVASVHRDSLDRSAFTVSVTGNTKKIAGYNATEYEVVSQDFTATHYITKEMKVTWRNTFGAMMEKFSPGSFEMDTIDGFLLESHNVHNSDHDLDNTFLVTKVEDKEFELVQADFEFGSLAQ